MATRLIVAYSLIALMVLAAGAVIWWNMYHSWRRTDARRRAKLTGQYRKRDAAAPPRNINH